MPGARPRPQTVALLVVLGGFLSHAAENVHQIESPHQSGPTTVRVFVPEAYSTQEPLKTLYVLPVEAGDRKRWGDPVAEIRRLGIAERHGLVVALPTFSDLPWYADHPSNRSLRQETYLLEDVLPLIESSYWVNRGPEARPLVGFSKSGWGAWSLLLRHLETFGKAAAWDAPLMQASPDRFGMGPIFGSQENFERYRITALIGARKSLFQQRCRLVLTGYAGAFRTHHRAMHRLLVDLSIPHAYRDGPQRDHQWNSGWLEEAIAMLMEDCQTFGPQ